MAQDEIEDNFSLSESVQLVAYPNPFNTSSKLLFTVPSDQHVTIKVYSITGQEIATLYNDDAKAQTAVEVNFTPEQTVSGTFIVRMVTADGSSKQAVIVKTN